MNPPSATEKTNKKVSRACNTCRLKRKKCDGLDPCLFCTETKVECSYSREPRRRGPPSGYLRYTETRVTLLETLLGLCISKSSRKSLPDLTLECIQILQTEAKNCTQDIWDGYKVLWTGSQAAKILDDLTNNFAPFPQRTEQESFAKPLLPPPINTKSNGSGTSPAVIHNTPSPTNTMPKDSTLWSSPSVSFAIPPSPSFSLPRESFERTQTPIPVVKEQTFVIPRNSLEFGFPSAGLASTSTSAYPPPSPNYFSPDVDIEMAVADDRAYTGSYWRAADFDATSPSQRNDLLPPVDQGDLPPPHVLAGLLDVYYQHVHSSYPLLLPRRLLEPNLTGPNVSESMSCLILALCSYSGRLSPSLDAANLSMFGGDPGKIAADLWYEQARTALGAVVRKEARLETIQALVFLALRDHGRGNESQAWILIGTAIRMGQELDLHMPPPSKSRLSPEEIQVRQNVWGVCLLLDLLLSLQLGKPPAVADGLRSPPVLPSPQSQSLFSHTYTLCHIVSRINLHLYFGFTPSAPTALATLKQELDLWQQTLPMQFRISLGHQPEQKVLEVNMFYHVAVILLYRPFYKDKSKVGVFLDAASTFNMLLEKYRNAAASPSSLSVSSPSMIYLIFTTAIAHLSGYKYKETTESHSTTAALQTQLHLLHCLEALKAIGGTWELARRCWRTLDRLMEVEGLRPSVPGEVKRKRDGDDHPPPRQREEPASASANTALVFPPSTAEGLFPLGDMNLSPLLLPADYFDPSLNMAWLPDVGTGLWDGEWDEKFWGKSLVGLGLDGVSSSQDPAS